MTQTELVVQDSIEAFYPPAPTPRLTPLGSLALLRVLANNPLEAWTKAHFEKPIVLGGLSIGRVALVNDPAAIRRVLMENSQNYHKDWLQRRVLSAGLTNGLLTAEGNQWRVQRPRWPAVRAPDYFELLSPHGRCGGPSRRAVNGRAGQVADLAVEATDSRGGAGTNDVLRGLGRNPEEFA